MNLNDLVSEAMRNLSRRKLRTGLTMTGVVIGALAVVLIVSLGNGLSSFIDQNVRSIANPKVVEAWPEDGIRPGQIAKGFLGGLGQPPREINPENEGDFIGAVDFGRITPNQITQLKQIKGVSAVRPFVLIMTRSLELVGDGREFDTIVSPWIQAGPVALLAGKSFNDDNAKECIVSEAYLVSLGIQQPEKLIGKRVRLHVSEHPVMNLIGGSNIDTATIKRIGDSIKTLRQPFKDSGGLFKGIVKKIRVLFSLIQEVEFNPSKGNGTETFEVTVIGVARKNLLSNIVYVPDGLAEKMGRVMLRNPKLYTPDAFGLAALLKVDDPADIPRVKGEVKKLKMRPRSLEDHLSVMHKIFGMFQKILVVFGGIAFVVAAFSIVNTLLMAVFERKREIGVLQALGATRRHIGMMFATEAVAIGFWGGVIGTIVGWSMCQIGNMWARGQWPYILGNSDAFLPPGWLFPVLLVFTTLLGLVAGVYPAWRAARLDPVEALRYE